MMVVMMERGNFFNDIIIKIFSTCSMPQTKLTNIVQFYVWVIIVYASAVSPVATSDTDVVLTSNMSNVDNAADVHNIKNNDDGDGDDGGAVTTITETAAVGGNNVATESYVTAGDNNEAAAGKNVRSLGGNYFLIGLGALPDANLCIVCLQNKLLCSC
jgi:hypothetical protein